MRRPGPWRTPVLPSGGSVGSLRLAGPALPSAPRRDAGLEARARAPAAAAASPASDAVAGGLGTAWQGDRLASGRGFRRRQAVDLSRRLHFVSSVFRSGTSTPHHLSPSRPLALRACVYKRSARFGRSLVPDLTSAGAACSDQMVRWVLGNFRL
ncbi:hypothetical protein D1007_45911 [Hordeum vulgare]|nr:hypothetical protein D1007_45911 [Hordeum vulgare]